MQVTITKIYTTDKDKQGNPLKSKKGAPYTRMSIKTQEHGEKWLSGFQNADNKEWKEGDTVEIVVKENGEYLNFETPKKEDKVVEVMEKVLNKLTSMNLDIQIIKEHLEARAPKGTWGTLNSPNAVNNPNIPFAGDDEIPY